MTKDEYTKIADKHTIKEYITSLIDDERIIPTIDIWDKFDDIDFNTLPQKFVLKTTLGGGNSGDL